MDSQSITTLALPAVIDLDALDGVRDALAGAIETGPVCLDASAVERVSTNGLLMLISAAQTARRNDHLFEIAGPSQPMLSAIGRLGFEPSFSPLFKEPSPCAF